MIKRLISLLLMVGLFAGCAGTYYSRKKIPLKIDKATAKLYCGMDGAELAIDIERCYSSTDECSKIINGCECKENTEE